MLTRTQRPCCVRILLSRILPTTLFHRHRLSLYQSAKLLRTNKLYAYTTKTVLKQVLSVSVFGRVTVIAGTVAFLPLPAARCLSVTGAVDDYTMATEH